ncbi:hypothetical protein ABT120_38695 [Nonomuraea angiospora]|uniref:hypothetical protein n=1 Tax=Nonomuraea angiospora TaxID=46172 RepID=UPI003329BCF4
METGARKLESDLAHPIHLLTRLADAGEADEGGVGWRQAHGQVLSVAATEQDGGCGIQVTAAVMSGTRAKLDERLRHP